jgi:probable phosphomutase (TIGR03848 family)
MATFLLIRHGWTDLIGKALPGRRPGVSLNERGRRQAEKLASWLAVVPVDAIYSSPLERARETAAPLAAARGLSVNISEHFTEMEIGEWTGRTLEDLDGDPLWRRFNSFRSGTRPPGGELISEVQGRMTAHIERLRERHPLDSFAVISHGDPIKTVIAHYAGIPFDLMLRLEISPASVSIINLDTAGARIVGVNLTMEWS